MNCYRNLTIASIVTSGIFILDMKTPLGYAEQLLYVIPLIIVAPALRRTHIPLLPFIGTVLIMSGFFLSPSGPDLAMAITNRVLGALALWTMSFIIIKRRQALDAYQEVCAGMERSVAERTRQLSETNQMLQDEIAWRTKTQEELQESETKFRNLTERSMVGVYLLQDGVFRYTNPGFAEIFGSTVEELAEKSYEEVIFPEDLPHIEECLRKRLEGIEEFGHYTFRGVRRSGEIVHLEVFNSLTNYNGAPAVIGALLDITERVQLEGERKKYQEELLGARHQAEAASRAKSQFLANMSHELRTPMNGFMGVLQLLLGGHVGPLEAKQRELLLKADRAAHSLLQIISDILDLSKIEAGKLLIEFKPFSLRECVSDAIDYFFADAQYKGLELAFSIDEDVPDALMGDHMRLRQILVNLIGNGIKFTQQGKVQVHVSTGSKADNGKRNLTFTIMDTGIGIPADKQDLLFRSFSQVDASETRTYGGTGLGLAISKQIVEMMGGTISLDSKEGIGSTFSFTVPFEETGEAAGAAAKTGTHPSAAAAPLLPETEVVPRILVAEDDILAGELLKQILQVYGLEMDLARTGQEAVEMWEAGYYDLIIMDVQMPRMDGIAATKIIREKEKKTGGHIPIVAMTAHAFREDEEKCYAAGMDGYLTKPLDLEKGREVIMSFIRK